MTSSRRSALGDGIWLTIASAVNGATAYAFAVIGTRYLGAAAFADVSVAWSFWALTVAVLTLPVQHWLTWRSEVDRGLAGVLGARQRLLILGLVASALIGLSAMQPRFFSVPTTWALVVFALGVGSWLLGWGRGMLAAHGDYRRLAFVIGGENAIRVLALIGVIAIGGGPLLVGGALLVGPLILVFVHAQLRAPPGVDARRVPVMRAVFVLSGAMAMAQSILQLGPAAAAWIGQSDVTVTATFSTFALLRAPVVVLLALSSRVTAPITRLVADRAFGTLQRLAAWSVGVTVVAAAVAGGVGTLVGPTIVEAFFGPETSLSGSETALVAAGMVLASYALLQLLFFLSSERTSQAVMIWVGASVAGVVLLNVATTGPVAVAFFASELSAVAAGAIVHHRWLRSRVEALTK